MRKSIKINIDTVNGTESIPPIECDDAIVISSNIDGAVLNATADGDPAYTRKVGVWVGGFRTAGELFTRLSQAIIQVITQTGDEEAVKHNLLNFLVFVIEHSTLKSQVSLHVREGFIDNTKEGSVHHEKKA